MQTPTPMTTPTRHPARALLLWLLAMAAGAVVVWNSRFVADVSFFLPARPSATQQVLIDQLKEGTVARLLMLGIAGGDAETRAATSRRLRERLVARPDFVSVQNGEAATFAAERDLLFRHRYLLSPAVTPERFSEDGLRRAIGDSIDLLASPAGMLVKPFLTRDPTGELFEVVTRLDAGSQPASRAGVWASRDGERAMLLVQTRALGSDTDAQEAAIAAIESEFAAVRDEVRSRAPAGSPELSLLLSGPSRFAVAARATVKDDVARLSTIATLTITIILFFVYRSPRLVALGLLPVASGTLAGVVAVALTHDAVFGVTVGFGSALIGEAVDYSIYYFVQSGRVGADRWRERFWPTVRLGVATSLFGFGALLFSGFPGLAQLGLYALAGILTAALVTRYVLPQLTGNGSGCRGVRDLCAIGRRLAVAIGVLQKLRWPTLALAAAAIVYLGVERHALWHADLSVLSTVSAAEAKLDGALRADLGAPDSRYLVVVTGTDREAALQAAERAGRTLDRLAADGAIGGYDSPARFLPSAATQQARQASLPPADELKPRLAAALAGLPLAANKLEPFLAQIDAARRAPPLTRADLDGSGLALAVDALLRDHGDRWSVLLPLRPAVGVNGGNDPMVAAERVRTALAGSDALFIDMKGEFDSLYGDYLSEAVRLSAAGFVAIVVLLAAVLRSPRRLAAVLLPLLLAVVLVIAALHLAGQRLHLVHLIGMLFIVAVGSNYALFFHHGGAHGGDAANTPDPETLASMALATLTSVIGFGTLALSAVPVLQAIGLTVGPGTVLALLLSAMFLPRSRVTSEAGSGAESRGTGNRAGSAAP